VRHREPLDLAVRAEHVDCAPVGQRRHAEPGELAQRAVVVERGREQLARLGEERHPLAQRLLGFVEPRAGERLRGLPRERQLHLPAVGVELDVLVERQRHAAEDAALHCEGHDDECMPALAPVCEIREEPVAFLQRRDEKRLAGADHLRHGQLGVDRERGPAGHDRLVVAALRKQFDVLAVRAQDADRAGTRLGRAHTLGQDGVEHLLRRDCFREELRHALEPPGAIGSLGVLGGAHGSGSDEIARVSCSRSPRAMRRRTSSTTSPIPTGSNGLTT
jgi:hypothetical protein